MKHAYLIMAHHEPYILDILLSKLSHPDNTFFIHIDKKIKEHSRNQLEIIINKWGGEVVNKCINIQWGDYSQIETELLLYKIALNYSVRFDYFHLLSGVDLPIKPIDEMQMFFERHPGKNYLHVANDEGNRAQIKWRTNYYHFFTCFGRSNGFFWRMLRYFRIPGLSIFIQKVLKINRGRNNNICFYKGNSWCSLTRSAVSYLVEKENYIRRRFRFTSCSDEIYKQTLLMNSSFRYQIHTPCTDNQNADLRLIEWERGEPHVWNINDVEVISKSENLFARKFSSKYQNVIDYVAQHI